MSENNQRPGPPDNPDRRGGGNEPQGFNWKGLIILSIAIGLLAAGLMVPSSARGQQLDYRAFVEKLQKDEVNKDSVKKITEVGAEVLTFTTGEGPQKQTFRVPFDSSMEKERLNKIFD
jgi:hypothetical protein